MTPRTAAEFAGAPWRKVRLGRLKDANRVPTMLSRPERKLYHWLTADWMRGLGEVVELGTYVGGSTAYLAAGHAAAGHPGMIHAYDKFTSSEGLKARLLYANGVPEFDGPDILPTAGRLLAPWADRLALHKGNIEELGWSGGPIELLIVDAFKKVALIDRMTADFYPALIPGQSLLVHQDFLHWTQPWLVSQMLRLGAAVEPVTMAEPDTMAFLVRAPLDPGRLVAARVAALSDADMLDDLDRARVWLAAFGLDGRLDAMARGLRLNPGARIAWRMTNRPW
ncbi:MAG: hypothetical protein QNJ16_03710 [Rhodobacter sp.]|nr:hypothetical protein [Rhodobacter sp.]